MDIKINSIKARRSFADLSNETGLGGYPKGKAIDAMVPMDDLEAILPREDQKDYRSVQDKHY